MKKKFIRISILLCAFIFVLMTAGCYYLPEEPSASYVQPTPEPVETPTPSSPPSTVPSPSPSKEAETLTPALYKVTGENGKGTLYLFGSIHVGDEGMYPLPEAVLQAYEKSDALAVEYDIVAEMDEDVLADYYDSILYPRGTTITDDIDPGLYTAAVAILKENNLYTETLDYYKPILWNDLFSLIASEQAALSNEYGIDRFFLQQAHKEGKEILEVESMQFQMEMMLSFPDKLQVLFLNYNVEDYEDSAKDLQKTLQNWKKGTIWQEEESDTELYVPPKYVDYSKKEIETLYKDYYKTMIIDRNESMAKEAQKYLAQNKSVFFVVGEGHIGGETGIVQLLKDAGCRVERVQY